MRVAQLCCAGRSAALSVEQLLLRIQLSQCWSLIAFLSNFCSSHTALQPRIAPKLSLLVAYRPLALQTLEDLKEMGSMTVTNLQLIVGGVLGNLRRLAVLLSETVADFVPVGKIEDGEFIENEPDRGVGVSFAAETKETDRETFP